jgi:hypothetical protein
MTGESGPVEVHLPDGGRVAVTGEIDAVLDALVHASGSEADVQDAIREEAEAHGLSCSTAGSAGATILVVDRR